MASCCVYFFQCSRTWLAILVPISAALSCSHGSFLIPITFIFLFLSTIFLLTFSKRNSPLPPPENEVSCATEEAGEEEVVYSESESMDHFSSTSSSEDHSSDMEQRMDCSDGSISDEESLIEIAIPSVWNAKCCKQEFHKDFWAEMNEEDDNLIEIDIYMGSIKC